MKKSTPLVFLKLALAVFVIGLISSSMALAENAGKQSDEIAINVNAATVKELAVLPGVGKQKAKAIVAYKKTD
jgi:DNA uptake protein ComE-like DNA-binding protein